MTTGFCKTCEKRVKNPSYPRECKVLVRDRGSLGIKKPRDFWTDDPEWEEKADRDIRAYMRGYFHASGG